MDTTTDNSTVVAVEDLPTIVLEAFGLLDDKTLHRLWISRQRWLIKADLMTITGFSQRKIDDLVARRTIPMWRAPGSHEWRLTQKNGRPASSG